MNVQLVIVALTAGAVGVLLGRLGGGETNISTPGSESTNAGSKVPRITNSKNSPAVSVQQLANGIEKRQRILALVDEAKTPAELEKLFKEFRGDDLAESSIIAGWTQQDPEGCLRWLVRRGANKGIRPEYHLRQTLFRTWAAQDARSAFKAAVAHQALPEYGDCVFEVLLAALHQSQDLGRELARLLPDIPRHFTFPESLWKVAPADLVRSIISPAKAPNAYLAKALQPALRAWSAKDPSAVVDWLESLPVTVSSPLLPAVVDGLGDKSPEAARALIAKIPSAMARDSAAGRLALAWLSKDPVAALNYAGGQLGPTRLSTFQVMSKSLIPQGTDAIVQTLAQIPDGRLRQELVPILVKEWIDEDPMASSQWISNLAPTPENLRVFQSVASRWAEGNPEAAMKFIQDKSGAEMDDIYQRIVSTHAGHSPESAVRLVLQQPTERQAAGVRASYNMMSTHYQSEVATEILSSLPTVELQMEAVRGYMERYATGNMILDEGLKWAKALPAGKLRDAARETLIHSIQLTAKERALAANGIQ